MFGFYDNSEEINLNRAIIQKYPWLFPITDNGKRVDESRFNFEKTSASTLSPGWKKAFFTKVNDEISEIGKENISATNHALCEFTNGVGVMRVFFESGDNHLDRAIRNMLDKYIFESETTCFWCGAKDCKKSYTEYPICENCIKKFEEDDKLVRHLLHDLTKPFWVRLNDGAVEHFDGTDWKVWSDKEEKNDNLKV